MRFDYDNLTCDGILYSDLWMLRSREFHNVLAARGLVFMTEFRTPEGIEYSGDIIAGDVRQAKQIAFGRGLGETISRPLRKIVY